MSTCKFQGNKILLIEDDQIMSKNISDVLSFERFTVTSTCTGEQGVELAETLNPELVLCDIVLPGMDGYEVYRTLAKIQSLSMTAFVFLTAKGERDHIRMGMDLGADDYLTKPFTFDELVSMVNSQLQKRESRLQNFVQNAPVAKELECKFSQQFEHFEQALCDFQSLLSLTEVRICFYVHSLLRSKEIADLLHISLRGVEQHRYRIRKKLNLGRTQSLYEFLHKLYNSKHP